MAIKLCVTHGCYFPLVTSLRRNLLQYIRKEIYCPLTSQVYSLCLRLSSWIYNIIHDITAYTTRGDRTGPPRHEGITYYLFLGLLALFFAFKLLISHGETNSICPF